MGTYFRASERLNSNFSGHPLAWYYCMYASSVAYCIVLQLTYLVRVEQQLASVPQSCLPLQNVVFIQEWEGEGEGEGGGVGKETEISHTPVNFDKNHLCQKCIRL